MNRRERLSLLATPGVRKILDTYDKAHRQSHGHERDAWASMVYACRDEATADHPAPPDWGRIVRDAPEGYWDARGGVPESYERDGVVMMKGKPPGCGYEEVRYLCVGVEAPRKLNGPAIGYPEVWVPTPFVAGSCPKCGLPMAHVDWHRDEEWWPPTELPEGAPHFRLPGADAAVGLAAHGYGGAEFVPGVYRNPVQKGGGVE